MTNSPNSISASSTIPNPVTRLTFQILTLAVLGMAALLALLPAAGHDQMWLLYAARHVLQGEPLYGPTLFETNPPLIIWLSLIPAALANLTHLPDTALGKLFVTLLELGIAALCLRQLRRIQTLTPATLYALAFTFITIFAVLPARDYGQRDHLLILFILPYVFAAAVRAQSLPISTWEATLIGILALAGVALKPHQTLIPIAIEATLLFYSPISLREMSGWDKAGHPDRSEAKWRDPRIGFCLFYSNLKFSLKRLARPEIIAILLSGLTFLADIQHFAPFYFTTILPLARETYWAYGQLTLPQLIAESIQLHLLALINLSLFLYLERAGQRDKACHPDRSEAEWRDPRIGFCSPLIRLLLISGTASTIAFYLQGTGWYYQQLPALSLFALALSFQLIELANRKPLTLPSWTPKATAALTVLALALTTHFTGYPFTPARSFPVDTPSPTFFANLPPNAAVLTLSPTVDDTIQPIFKYHLTLGQRYPAFLMLPALLRAEDPQNKPLKHIIPPQKLAELDHLQHQDMVEDLQRWHPALILIERCQAPEVHCQVLEDRHDNLLAFFQRDPLFTQIFNHYHLTRTEGPYDAYTPNP